jgi:hypothetical protein
VVAVLPAPDGEVQAQSRMPSGHGEPPARRQRGQRALDQEVPALVEPKVV